MYVRSNVGKPMNTGYELLQDVYLTVTPGGAYYAASQAEPDAVARLLFALLSEAATPLLGSIDLAQVCGGDAEGAASLLDSAQRLGLITGASTARHVPGGALAGVLPGMVERLSHDHKALIADAQGFCIANAGFTHEAAEEVSVLSADLASLSSRRSGVIQGNLRIESRNWALVDASGNSKLGFWPLRIGANTFVLVVQGVPAFNQWAYCDVVWALCKRYLT